jgi:carbonic anhydrase/acetyltransferase-like protein (isoleucine patch superfamily)
LVELLRVFLPCLVTMAIFVLFCSMVVACLELMPLWAAAIGAAVIASSLSAVSLLSVAYLKAGFIGRFEPTVKPLWCSYVWVNEVVNGLYEAVAAPALTPLMGTLFIAPLLRLMGCKIGKWVFLESTLFSEFDLVEIGDRAALNLGCTIQTHLFEDRIMKADRIRVGDECSIGNMAVVLYGTEMHRGSSLGPFSVLMKGEALPPFTRWRGIPTEPVEADPPRRESKHKREPFVARASWRVRGRFSGSELFVSHDGALNYRPRGRAAHTSGTNARRERRRAHRRFSRSETPSSGLRHEPQGLRQRHRSEGT